MQVRKDGHFVYQGVQNLISHNEFPKEKVQKFIINHLLLPL